MRIIKKHDDRKNEIMNAAENLFNSKGYGATTINDILRATGIAKGTLYHYFQSKEQVMHDLIMRYVNRNADAVREIVSDTNMSAVEKLRIMNTSEYTDTHKQHEMTRIQKVDNAEMHLKILLEAVQTFTPLLTQVIEQGVKEGSFKTDYPYDSAELLMILYQFIFDGEIFYLTLKEKVAKAKAHAHFMECVLHTKPGTFDFMYKRYEKYLK
ncbi:TetR/AcrR family transcriptional regulator [Parelusimicrobium proximum]|uniref:TetR/AcrR family transcriptional regulator n=1 Tax=Parelusimicrobium proximum TaxID=3228953 RepID=UPI003D184D0C